MNEKKLQKVDYLLALIPVFIFIFPIASFLAVLFKLIDSIVIIIILGAFFFFVLFFFSWITWSWKMVLKPRPISESVRKGFVLSGIDFFVLLFILGQFAILENLTDTYQVIWELFMGFVSIVFITVLADLHKLPKVYTYSMKWIQKRIY